MTPLNPGIVRTVAWLNSLGYKTCDSGDGKTHDFECDREDAYVVVVVDPCDMAYHAEVIMELLAEVHGIELRPVGELPHIQADYDPVNGLAFVHLVGVDDTMLAGEVTQ